MNQGTGKCSACGAPLPPFMESDGRVRCGSCGMANTAAAPSTLGVPAGGYGAPPGGYGAPPGGYGGAPGPFGPPGTVAPRGGCGVAGVLVVLAVVAVIIGGAGFAAFSMRARRAVTGPTSIGPVTTVGGGAIVATMPSWEGVHGVILTDVNGDGVPDVVGRVRYVANGDKVHLAAFEGITGRKLWESEPLGTYSDTYQGPMALAEDTLVVGRANGEMSGWGLHDGKKRWTGSVPEKTKHFCKGDHTGEVRVVLADQTTAVVHLADGHASAPVAMPKAESCIRLWSDEGPGGDPTFDAHGNFGADTNVDGMRGSVVMQHPGGPKIILGSRAKGTQVPMIAAVYPDPSHNWKSDLPGSRPLETSTSGSTYASVTATRVFTEYGFTSGGSTPHEVVAFDLTGHRLWETALSTSSPMSAIDSDDRRVFVSQWSHLSVLDASTGQLLYVVGK